MVSYYNPALSMFPGHAPSQVRHSPHASAAAAVAAQTASYFPSAYTAAGYHHQQFSAAAQYPNILDPNFNVAAPQFPHSTGTASSASQFESGAQVTSSPSSWHSGWAAHTSSGSAIPPAPGSPFRSAVYPDSWPSELQGPNSSDVPAEGGVPNPEHSPNPANDNATSSRTAVPSSSASPGFNNSPSSGSPLGNTTPTPVSQNNYSSGSTSASFMQASPAGFKGDAGAVNSCSSTSGFGLPSCITVTSQSGPTADSAHAALSSGSLGPKLEGSLGGVTSNGRPQPARSPFEWMKKPSYQSQPDKNGKRLPAHALTNYEQFQFYGY